MPTKKLLSITHEGVAFLRGPRRGRYTPIHEVPASTVVRLFDFAEAAETSLVLRGDLSIQQALDEARSAIPDLEATTYLEAYNARNIPPEWKLS